MLNKVLIANRGEIACRVMQTAKALGIGTVAVYSDADRNARHVEMADEAIHIGEAPSKDSYLRADKVLEAAKRSGADAIHPGYGFLSENAAFSRACADNGVIFIGPPASAIEAMGSKSAAKKIMEDAGVPLVPGYHGEDQSPALLKSEAEKIGFPVLLKAAAGGGGKGMRQVWKLEEFDEALAAAKREAQAGFGDEHMLVEKYLTKPRHVEIQVFFDQQGNGVYLFERDCSLQRRHQKVVEEAPAPGVSAELRKAMGGAAIKAAAAINYVGAGTVEFLLDEDGSFYFREMNTRLQVEHPVTEKITGQDLVAWQLAVADGKPLPMSQDELNINGHSLEVRVYAEDPDNDFLPATGSLKFLQTPSESDYVRVDTGVRQGDEVSVYYDPMIAKLIVWDEDRDSALQRLREALKSYRIHGVTTNLELLGNIAASPSFAEAKLETGFLEKYRDEVFRESDLASADKLALSALLLVLQQSSAHSDESPWQANDNWRLNAGHQQYFHIAIDGEVCEFTVTDDHGQYSIDSDGENISVSGQLNGDSLIANRDGHSQRYSYAKTDSGFILFVGARVIEIDTSLKNWEDEGDSGEGGLTAPMNGTIVECAVEAGSEVSKGDTLLIMEAMKMEHRITAPADGTVVEFFFKAGELVDGGAELLSFEPS